MTTKEAVKKTSTTDDNKTKDLIVNLDKALIQQIFPSSTDETALLSHHQSHQSAFMSIDNTTEIHHHSAATASKRSKLTWYKAEVEPCVGTSLFFELPAESVSNTTNTVVTAAEAQLT